MDTFKDKQSLEELNQESAPWKMWRNAVPALAENPVVLSAKA
jgi:hypothetical protein